MSSNLVVAEDAIFREDQQKIQLIYQAVENLQLENKSDYKLLVPHHLRINKDLVILEIW